MKKPDFLCKHQKQRPACLQLCRFIDILYIFLKFKNLLSLASLVSREDRRFEFYLFENSKRQFLPRRSSYETRCEKTGLRGFRPGPTQIGLYSHRRWLEA